MKPENRLQQLEAELAFIAHVDDLLEESLKDKHPLQQVLTRLMPLLQEKISCQNLMVRTFNEGLKLESFYLTNQTFAKGWDDSLRENYYYEKSGNILLGRAIDVSGEWFGHIVAQFNNALEKEEQEKALRWIELWSEELDNFLAMIVRSRIKYRVTTEIATALTSQSLSRGINRAISVLKENVDFEDLMIFYWDQEKHQKTHYKLILNRQESYDSSDTPHKEVEDFLDHRPTELLQNPNFPLSNVLHEKDFFEEELIYGIQSQFVVGRIAIGRQNGSFSTFDLDLLHIFAASLRQRIVDFNREYRSLSQFFSQKTITRLMQTSRYKDNVLSPRDENVAILYTDISGFTRVSEQVLKEPNLIGQFIDCWSEGAVDIVWKYGGVFDKLVGDCIIALFGPPFFEMSPQESCQAALEAAREVRQFTESISQTSGIEKLKGQELTVSTGLNFAPLFVGLFGPNSDYTGFSSGMNNTARLQGLADNGEILGMDEFVKTLSVASSEVTKSFSAVKEKEVKNVFEPLKYHSYIG